jgi:exopolyphosphatase/guanosine-5'-triphosphate,3'-diphosphate pyrophosphatase
MPEAATATISPTPVAVIDIGASGVRLRIAELIGPGQVRTLESLQHAVHLGKDAFTTRTIQQSTIEECVKILQGFKRVMEEYGITREDQVRAVATSALREAENRFTVIDRIYSATQINVEIIEGAEENRLTYIAVQDVLQQHGLLAHDDALIVDVGGGSTELMLAQNGEVTFAGSYRLGSLRMRETLETYRAPADRVRAILQQHLQRTITQLFHSVPVDKAHWLIAISGDAQFAASLLSPGWAHAQLNQISSRKFTGKAEELVAVPVDELVRSYQIPYQEAETVGPALLAYAELARVFKVKQVIVPKASLRDGLLKEWSNRGMWTEEFAEQAILSAESLGKKYHFDDRHAHQVANLSVRIFRELQAEHRLDRRYELLLRIGALLHEVGLFISDRSHHKHSMYIIMNSDLFGLTKKDISQIALIARYHRRATPRPYHEIYTLLDRDSRIAVTKLAAILRVADALDRGHMQQVRDLSFRREDGQFVIAVADVADLTLERVAMKEKANMFEDVYGMQVVLRSGTVSPAEATHV